MRTDRTAETQLTLLVKGRRMVADGVVELTLCDPSGAPLPGWEPGAHVDLVLADDLVRQYSLCGDPGERGAWTVAVLCEMAGRGGSRFVHERLEEGSLITVRGPRNHFPLTAAGRFVFIAGGIGITPLLPMVAAAQASGADWELFYGGRTRESMAYCGVLEERFGDRVDVRPQDLMGLLDLDAALGCPRAGTAVYCCGPEALLLAVEQRCAAWPPGCLHVERFSPKTGVEPARNASFEVELAASGITVTVPPDRSILDVVEEAGLDVPSSCQEGTCGTCETRVLDGVPDHRDSILDDEERASNETIMICVSRALSGRLVLDM